MLVFVAEKEVYNYIYNILVTQIARNCKSCY